MSSNNLVRFAGISGIIVAVCMLGFMFSVDPETFKPNSPLFSAFLWGSVAFGIIFTVGLYSFYRHESPTGSLVATAISLIGYVLFGVASFSWQPGSLVTTIGDIAIYIVGVALFSWLAYSTRQVSRILAIVGFVSALSGIAEYALASTLGEKAGATTALYMVYFFLSLVWLVWTGVSLLRAKTQSLAATA